jgi:hypothetical protein
LPKLCLRKNVSAGIYFVKKQSNLITMENRSQNTTQPELINHLLEYLSAKSNAQKAVEFQEIRPRQGRIIDFNGKKIGVYRDRNDHFHIMSSESSKVRGVIKWDVNEQSWAPLANNNE